MELLNGEIGEGTFTYRDISLSLFLDSYANQLFFIYNGGRVYLGKDNGNFENFIKAYIDDQLDTVFRFPDFTAAKLERFQNGNYRDIRLVYKKRVLKIFLVADENKLNVNNLISDSLIILQKMRDEIPEISN